MFKEDIPSSLLANAVSEFHKLPGIGSKTALRLVLHVLNQQDHEVKQFAQAMVDLKTHVKFCKSCNNISDTEICSICGSHSRNEKLICVVEGIKDVMAIEKTSQYNGVYHVLGGVISPLDGIGPSDLSIVLLLERLQKLEKGEIVFALPATMEGDTTCFYIHKKIENKNINFTTLSRGISIGDEIEYADELTLGRSILNRTAFEPNLKS